MPRAASTRENKRRAHMLRELRKAIGRIFLKSDSQAAYLEALVNPIPVSLSTYSRWESAKTTPTEDLWSNFRSALLEYLSQKTSLAEDICSALDDPLENDESWQTLLRQLPGIDPELLEAKRKRILAEEGPRTSPECFLPTQRENIERAFSSDAHLQEFKRTGLLPGAAKLRRPDWPESTLKAVRLKAKSVLRGRIAYEFDIGELNERRETGGASGDSDIEYQEWEAEMLGELSGICDCLLGYVQLESLVNSLYERWLNKRRTDNDKRYARKLLSEVLQALAKTALDPSQKVPVPVPVSSIKKTQID